MTQLRVPYVCIIFHHANVIEVHAIEAASDDGAIDACSHLSAANTVCTDVELWHCGAKLRHFSRAIEPVSTRV